MERKGQRSFESSPKNSDPFSAERGLSNAFVVSSPRPATIGRGKLPSHLQCSDHR